MNDDYEWAETTFMLGPGLPAGEATFVKVRRLPLAVDRDRIAAARYAAEKLRDRLNDLAQRQKRCWISYVDSGGGVRSENV